MDAGANQELQKWKLELEAIWGEIPKPFRNDHTVRGTLKCALYGRLRQLGYRVVADYMPPRIQDRPVDLMALNENQEILYSICFDTVVTLAAVKSLDSFESRNKVIYTIGALEKKVKESRFFLKGDIQHCHLVSAGTRL